MGVGSVLRPRAPEIGDGTTAVRRTKAQAAGP